MTLLAVHSVDAGPLPLDRPAIHVDDEGLLRGRSAFETLRVYRGHPLLLEQHLVRLRHTAALLGLPEPDLGGLATTGTHAIAASGQPDAVLRLLWTPGRAGARAPLGLALVSTLPPDLEQLRARGLRLTALKWAPGSRLATAKSTSYAENFAAQEEARRRGYDDALLISSDRVVLEAPTANIWWREGQVLHTPTLDQPILHGVTRAALWGLSRTAGYEPSEGIYRLERLFAADEVFLSSSVREVMPVTTLNGTGIGDGRPGTAARALQDALRALATGEPHSAEPAT